MKKNAGALLHCKLPQNSVEGYVPLFRETRLAAAKYKGQIDGRPILSSSDRKVQLAQEMTERGIKIKDACLGLGISRSTYYRYLKLNALI